MAGETIIGERQASQPGTAKTIPCARCKEQMALIVPRPEIINGMTGSVVIFPHEEPQRCPSCGQAFAFMLTKCVGIEFTWAPVKAQEQPNIITVPAMNGLKV